MGDGAKANSLGGPVNSLFDVRRINQAVGQNMEAIHNRYDQLGLGVADPNVFAGDPATAAAAGGSLEYGSPGSAELTDLAGAQLAGQAQLGQLQNQNVNNPAIPGSAANVAQSNQQNIQNLASNQFSQGAQSEAG